MRPISPTPSKSATDETSPVVDPLAVEAKPPLTPAASPPRPWWGAQFSLLNLLLFTALIALAAAYVTMKSSFEKQLRDEQAAAEAKRAQALQEASLELAFAKNEQQVHNYLYHIPMLNSAAAIHVLRRSEQDRYPGLFVNLDPQKTYVLRSLSRHHGTSQQQNFVIKKIDSTRHAREVLSLHFYYGKADEPLSGAVEEVAGLHCEPILTKLAVDANGTRLSMRGLTTQAQEPNCPLELPPDGSSFHECFTRQQFLRGSGETLLFKISGRDAKPEQQSLQLSLEEIPESDLQRIDQPQYFAE